MTDREKLMDLLCDRMENGCERFCNKPYCYRVKDTANNLLANGVTFQKWIPVSERLPEKPGCVLCIWKYIGEDETYCDRLNFDGDRFPWENFGSYSKHKVTHWMPLPEPPKEEDNG